MNAGPSSSTSPVSDELTKGEDYSDDSGLPGSSKSSEDSFDMSDDEPMSVFEQAARYLEKHPGAHNFILGTMFGSVPQTRPCKSCSPVPFFDDEIKDSDGNPTFLGWTAEDYENMTDTCPVHYVEKMMAQQRLMEIDKQEHLEKSRKMEKLAQNAKKARERAAEKAEKRRQKSEAMRGAKKKIKMEVIEEEYVEDDDDYYDDDQPGPSKRKKPARTQWMCPLCGLSAKYGSCGCHSCGEWYHFGCVKIKKAKEVPKNWICNYCKS